MLTIRSAKAAASGLWVIIKMVLPDALVEVSKDIQNGGGIFGVQVAGGFVGQKQSRLVHQRPRDGYALLFAARKSPRLVLQAAFDAQKFERVVEIRGTCFDVGNILRQSDVVGGG